MPGGPDQDHQEPGCPRFSPANRPPRTNTRPVGNPLPGYFPPLIDQATFDKANFLLNSKGINRRGEEDKDHDNLFRGLLVDARSGQPILTSGTSTGIHRLTAQGPSG